MSPKDLESTSNFEDRGLTLFAHKKRVHILFNISRSKGNQSIKVDQLIECKINIFLEKSYTKCGGEASPRLFYKILKLRIDLEKHSEMLQNLFLLHVQVEFYQIY